jgi:hypothetical protein
MSDSGANAEIGAKPTNAAIKQIKMYEKELTKLNGQQITPSFDVDAMQEMKKKMELDEIQDSKLDLEDQTAEMNERQDEHVQEADEDLAGKSTEQ